MRRATTHLSVVVGCYNAARHLEKRLVELVAFLDGIDRPYEVLIVEDGSLDDSLPILRRLEAERAVDQRAAQPAQHGQGLLDPQRDPELARQATSSSPTSTWRTRSATCWRCSRDSKAAIRFVVGNRRLPESVYVVNNALVKYVYRRHRGGIAFNTLVRLLFGLTTRDTQSGLEGILEERGRADLSAALHRRVPVRHRDLHSQSRARHSGRRGARAADVRRRRHDGPAVQAAVHACIPELMHIKMLELRGAYGPRAPSRRDQVSEPEKAPSVGTARNR